MKEIRVPDKGVPICGQGLRIPILQGNEYIYEVTDNQAKKWNSFTQQQKLELVCKADREKKDLRKYL